MARVIFYSYQLELHQPMGLHTEFRTMLLASRTLLRSCVDVPAESQRIQDSLIRCRGSIFCHEMHCIATWLNLLLLLLLQLALASVIHCRSRAHLASLTEEVGADDATAPSLPDDQ